MRYLTYLILVFSTSLNAGAIHKWIDENGNVHYGDAPPAKTKSENVRVQPAPSNPGKALPRLSVSDEAQQGAGGSGDAAGNGSAPQMSAEQAARICESANKDLSVISNSSQVRLQQSDGSVRYLTDEEVAEHKAKAEEKVRQFCK